MSEILKKLLGKKIRSQRHRLGMSQNQLGEAINYSDATISAFERGDRAPGLFVAFSLADALDCSIEDLKPDRAEILSYQQSERED